MAVENDPHLIFAPSEELEALIRCLDPVTPAPRAISGLFEGSPRCPEPLFGPPGERLKPRNPSEESRPQKPQKETQDPTILARKLDGSIPQFVSTLPGTHKLAAPSGRFRYPSQPPFPIKRASPFRIVLPLLMPTHLEFVRPVPGPLAFGNAQPCLGLVSLAGSRDQTAVSDPAWVR